MTSSDSVRPLPTSRDCFVCGEDNHAGLGTRFYVENDVVKARLEARPHHCGYPNVVHGGVVAAILDETMGWAAARAIKRMCLTAELTVRYVRPAPADLPLTVTTAVTRHSARLAQTTAELADDNGTVYARAEARFIPLTVEQTLEVDDNLTYRGGEERVFDGLRDARSREGAETSSGR